MTGEVDPHRLEIAGRVSALELEVPNNPITAADLVLAIGDTQRYLSGALAMDDEQELTGGGSPRHWRFILPGIEKYTVDRVEFGLSDSDLTGHPIDEARFDHEFALDEIVDLNRDRPEVQHLFKHIGGLMVEAAKKSDDAFFAGLELRYKALEDGTIVKWVHLAYSRSLLDTQRRLKRFLNPNQDYPKWVKSVLKPSNRRVAAELMALSALTNVDSDSS